MAGSPLRVKGVRTAHGRVQLWALRDGWLEVPDVEFAARRWAPLVLLGLVMSPILVAEAQRGMPWAKPVGVVVLALFGVGVLGAAVSRFRIRVRTGRKPGQVTWPGLRQARTVATARKTASTFDYGDQVWVVARSDLAEVIVDRRRLWTSAYFRLGSGDEYKYWMIGIKAPERLGRLVGSTETRARGR